MLSITEIEQINQKLNPELALSLSLDNTKRMESPLLHSGFSPSTDMWKLILFYNGSLEEIKEMILEETHKSKLSMHPGTTKMYQDLKKMY